MQNQWVEEVSASPEVSLPSVLTESVSDRSPGRRLHGAVVQHLGTAIVSGKFLPGDVLRSEAEFSVALGVSRGAYREAIQFLGAKGLIETRAKSGTRVATRDSWRLLDPDVISWIFSSEPDERFVHDLSELRATVQPAAASLAAKRRNPGDLREMKAALIAMGRFPVRTDQGRAAISAFHDALLRATHNDAIITLSAGMSAVSSWTTKYTRSEGSLPRDPMPVYRRVYDAIVARDVSGADYAMRDLVNFTY